MLEEFYHAIKGHGAFLNDIKLPFSAVPQPFPQLSSCFIALEYGPDVRPNIMQKKMDTITRLAGKVRGIRSLGSATLEICYVARGTFDAFYEAGMILFLTSGIHIWDVGAAALILTEAGGYFGNFGETLVDGGKVDWRCRRFLAIRNSGSVEELDRAKAMILPLLDHIDLERDDE
jgi:fructose-1,6-bisphosphatase/inositol monophosphatase family enzyme